ncbi:MAG TPA: dihydropteroate synthase [Chloroflexota bacterium]|nr:dihydropteroate synthase [Chloroflexota bacterium]
MGPRLDLNSGPLDLKRARVMGILNRTPDSFYSGARHVDLSAALRRVEEMVAEGADIIDVGGEKAGPGPPVEVQEEIDRVVPVIQAVHDRIDVAISVDTVKPKVAKAAMAAGADIINSIEGFRDPALIRVGVETGAAVVVMHIQGRPRVPNRDPLYSDVVADVRAFLADRAAACRSAGIPADRIIIDPGPGFGKRAEHDLTLLHELDKLSSLPYPLLLAASRKPFIGAVLGTAPEDRLEGSLAVVAWGVLKGAKLLRVHDVRPTVRVVRMTEAVLTAGIPA